MADTSRICFVIMPFSKTQTCTEAEWTAVFTDVIKPAVENAGLGYECRRSAATRGNIVAAILRDLNDANVVIADLTDHNASVFYELGVRHALKNRTILLAQRKDDIPFDLQAYAYHVYNWKTDEGRRELADKLCHLLSDVDANSEKPDNPVSDFLHTFYKAPSVSASVEVSADEITAAQSLAGPSSEGLDAVEFAKKLVRKGNPKDIKTVLKLTRFELLPILQEKVTALNQRKGDESVQSDQISIRAKPYIDEVENTIWKAEQFVLTSIDEGSETVVSIPIKLAGDLISITERHPAGLSIRFVQGLPALLAWRLLVLSGAKALAEENFDILRGILTEAIEVEEAGSRFSNRSFIQRRELFYPETFLGYADHAVAYLKDLGKNQPHLQKLFDSEKDYHFAVAKFLMVYALAAPLTEDGYSIYPGYSWFPEASRAMSSLCSKLSNSGAYLNSVAEAMGLSGSILKATWSERVKPLNEVASKSQRRFGGLLFPDPMSAKVIER